MKRRWRPEVWLLGGLVVIIGAVALDAGRTMFPTKDEIVQEGRGPKAPRFKEGDLAPDFTLPDHNGKDHRLSELVKGDTLLFFTCGCANCMEVQSYVSKLRKKMGAKAPSVVNVTTMKAEGEESWIQRTELPQTILYEAKEGPVMRQYQGHPCPRVYRVRPDRTVAWIGPSPAMGAPIQMIGMAVANNLGFNSIFPSGGMPGRDGKGGAPPSMGHPAEKAPAAQKSTHHEGEPHASHSSG